MTQSASLNTYGTAAIESKTIALRAGLALMGWEVETVEIDMAAERAVLVLKRYDGRWLHVAGTKDRATVERWQRRMVMARDFDLVRPRTNLASERAEETFLGRDRTPRVRSALRLACTYVADNPAPGRQALPVAAVRALLAPLMAVTL